ncbi:MULTISPECIES: hypothetical protein [unclassified Oleiphilus]|jgi:hypothetical protein|uniref:hypothetical protein n=1 Tax=unclassified Oleiphilus TaxID=2631174 RepID=UPI0007C1FC9B|nr:MULTISPECIES: hypothetical protein [unclassified Oleiphilus]KZY35931.1 hypothetical protein A3729_17305 [Oleiphilus sp. HI0043]KZY41769.1 hypothetical protein A3732_17530 [Oleiphilus sp. HI0050]KZY78356.1 hypothetical protein A3740_07800 [Oleiphilus sp. HI0068]KZY85696.1 hypothetical protein A3741_15080 [Oleiphilus sp. HI0069]KZY88582.1 hypothetical protein A3743_11245 [Oleiphilus sp. HI0072]KZZ10858.1 hypothetical protein A3749_10175 [Oleiphilus sp. HI0078]KZZ20282.1 hypothetical protein
MRNLCLFLFLCLQVGIVNSSGLPPEHEVERLLLALKESVENGNWEHATSQLVLMRKLDVPQPLESHYFEGLVKIRKQEFHSARQVLERYVISSGSQGQFYEQALRLITEAEEAEKSLEGSGQKNKTSIEMVELPQRDGYIKSLQALYLTQDPVEALSMQINSLLNAHPYTGSRIKKNGVKEGLVYHLGVVKGGVTLQEKSYQDGAPMLSATSLQVAGLDPFIGAGCSSLEYACWLLHPSDKHQRWIKIDYDEMVVDELRDAMTKLLQSLQQDL